MRRDVLELREFYAGPLGAVARRTVLRRLADAWGDAAGQDLLGLGYATPWLDAFPAARRTVAAMPQGQGAEGWPAAARNRVALVDERHLPYPNALFDRVLIVHGLEESDDPARLLAEAGRVMTASGRLVIAAAARGGLWAGVERTPFGHGRPFTRGQLERLVRDAGLEPLAWSKALYAPPWKPLARWADSLEQIGARVLPALAGVILLEAVKQTYALQGRGRVAVAHAPVGAVLEPQPAGRNANRDLARRGEHR